MNVRWCAPGAAMAAAVAEEIRRVQGGDPLALVRVVTPDAATNDGLRRALPFAGGVCGIEVTGTLRLARQLAGPAQRTATPVAVLAAVQQVLESEACPAALRPCRAHPATHDALVRAWDSLNGAFTLENGAAQLRGVAHGRLSATAVVQVLIAVRSRLLSQGWQDHAALLTAATAVAAGGPQPPTVVVVTQQFNPAHVELVRTVLHSSTAASVVAVAFPDGPLSSAAHVARLIDAQPPAGPPPVPVPDHVTVLSCPDHDEEVREVARRIVRLLHGGAVADRIAVYYPAAGPHREALRSTLAAAGIARRGQVRPALNGTVAGQVVRAMLGALDRGEGLSRPVVLELARLAASRQRSVARWTRNCRELGIVAEADWELWPTVGDHDEAEGADGEGQRGSRQGRGGWRRTALDRDLVGFVAAQRGARQAVRAATSWAQLATALGRWLARLIGDDAWRQTHWQGYPTYQFEAATQVAALVEDLRALDEIGVQRSVATASRLLLAGLEDDVITAESKGAGVFVGQVVGAPGGVFEHVFVVGANEGLLPGTVADDLVLTAAHGPEPLGVLTGPANRPLRDERGVFAALRGASASVTVTFARYEIRRGGELFAAPFLGALPPAAEIDSHAGQLVGAGDAWLNRAEWFAADPARRHPRLQRRRRAITARLDDRPGEYDGQVGALVAGARTDPFGRAGGVTALETFSKCGLQFFVERVLGAGSQDADAIELTDIDPRDRGSVIHAVLDQLCRRWLDDHPNPADPWVASERDVARLLADAADVLDQVAEPFRQRRRLGHEEMWRARRSHILRGIEAELRHDLVHRVVPLYSEFAFGDDDQPVQWTSASGDVGFVGFIDRVNRTADGLEVVDYKAGNPTRYRQIRQEAPLGATNQFLQLPFYGWGVEAALGEPVTQVAYRFVGQDDDVEVRLRLDDQVRQTHRRQLDEYLAMIRSGQFVPGEVDSGLYGCAVCCPDQLGRDEVNQRRLVWGSHE